DLLERINDLAGLSMVRHILEKREKNSRLDQRRASHFRHQSILHSESEDGYRFSSNPFCHPTSSPDCPGLFPGQAKTMTTVKLMRLIVDPRRGGHCVEC